MSATICSVFINHPEFKLLNLCLLPAFTDKSACAQSEQICISNPAGLMSGFQFSTVTNVGDDVVTEVDSDQLKVSLILRQLLKLACSHLSCFRCLGVVG